LNLVSVLKQDINRIIFNASGSWRGSWPFLLALSIPLLMSSIIIFESPLAVETYEFVTACLVLCLPAFIWIKLHRVKIEKGTIHYRSGLGFSKQVDISNGFKAKAVAKAGGVWGWMIKMPRNFYSVSNGREEVLMNLKPFSRSDLRKIRELLPEK